MITYFEHYPHYMGTKNTTIKFTKVEFDTLINLAKAAIKENKVLDGGEGDADEALYDYVEALEKKNKVTVYALTDALINYYDSPKRPASIVNAILKKGVWSGEWEEGSHAFGTSTKKAKKAVGKIEAKHTMDEF